jgi:hypothetical protein
MLPSVKYSISGLVRSGQLKKTSSITSKQSCSGQPKSITNRVAGFSLNNFQPDAWVFMQHTLVFDHPSVSQPLISLILHDHRDGIGEPSQ